MRGIVSYGVYLPYWRLQRSSITGALGQGGGRGTRTVASFDEDTTSMGVEASRLALASTSVAPGQVLFTTADPAYLDKTNATGIHAALDLDRSVPAFDLGGAARSAFGVYRLANESSLPSLVVASDIRTGLPGGADEANGGDAAVALLFSGEAHENDVIATPIGGGSATSEFLDRWRTPGDPYSKVWEERFGEFAYLPLADIAVTDALKSAGITASDLDHVIVTGLHARAARGVAGRIGARPEALADDLSAVIGNTGIAQQGVVLASVLDKAAPNQTILLVSLADGVDAVVLRTTEKLLDFRAKQSSTVAAQLAAGRDDLPYPAFLTWRGFLDREPPRRPDPERPAAPPAYRSEHWKYGFTGSRCQACGTRHLPPARVCVKCSSVDQMDDERMCDVPGTIATYTIDRLAYSLNPPTVFVVVDFDGGGRYQFEMTDVDPAQVQIGQRIEMTFRRFYTADGVHNYFWKARPVRSAQ